MRIACWKTKAISSHSQHIKIIAFLRQELLHDRSSKLRFYVQCVSCYGIRLPFVTSDGTRMKLN